MNILAFFTNNGVPATGLSPTIRIRDVSDNSLVVTDAAMTEIGDGSYKYNFTTYDKDVDYSIRCDGGAILPDAERYTYGGNENYIDDITESLPSSGQTASAVWDKDTASHQLSGSFGKVVQKTQTTVNAVSASFQFEDGAIWLANDIGSPNGSGRAGDPVDTIDTAVALANANNLKRIRIVGFGYYVLGVAMTDFQVISTSNLGYNFIDLGAGAGHDVTGTHFYGVGIWKNNAGDITFSQFSAENCNMFSPMDDVSGVFTRCFFLGVINTSKFQIVDGLPSIFIDCAAGTPGEKLAGSGNYITPTFSLKSIQATPAAQEVVFQRYSGNIIFQGMDHPDSYCDINMVGGLVTLNSDNVSGSYRISGVCELVDNTGPDCTVIDNRGAEQSTVLRLGYDDGAVWADSVLGDDNNSGKVGDPVQTLSRAKVVASDISSTRIHINNFHTLTEDLVGYQVYSGDQFNSGIEFNNYSVSGSTFYDMVLLGTPTTGTLQGYVAIGCYLFSLSHGGGNPNPLNIGYVQCALGGRSIDPYTVQPNVSVSLDKCYAVGTGNLDPQTGVTFDLGNGTALKPIDLNLTNWSGNLILRNLTDGNVWIHGQGKVTISSTCTGGNITIRGAFEVVTVSGATSTIDNQATSLDLDLKRVLGLVHENIFIDQPNYDSDGNLISARLRIYSNPSSVGTGSDVIGTYQINAPSTAPGQFTSWQQVRTS